jgi:transcriptional regulator with XRE-family HTH domain
MTYVSRLERGLENPTVAVLQRLAIALSSNIEELFRVPRAGEPPPQPLKGGQAFESLAIGVSFTRAFKNGFMRGKPRASDLRHCVIRGASTVRFG